MIKILIIIFIFFTVIFSLKFIDPIYADEIDSKVKILPDTEEYYGLCEAAKTDVWEDVYKEKKQEFLKFINFASQVILKFENHVIGVPDPKKWAQVFKKSELTWLKQLELDREAYYYSESGLGGNRNYRDSLRFAVDKINDRLEEVKKNWWLNKKD